MEAATADKTTNIHEPNEESFVCHRQHTQTHIYPLLQEIQAEWAIVDISSNKIQLIRKKTICRLQHKAYMLKRIQMISHLKLHASIFHRYRSQSLKKISLKMNGNANASTISKGWQAKIDVGKKRHRKMRREREREYETKTSTMKSANYERKYKQISISNDCNLYQSSKNKSS